MRIFGMNTLSNQLNNREWATLLLLSALLIWFLLDRKRRSSIQPHIRALFNAFLHKKILAAVLSMVLYISLTVFALERVGIWNAASHLKDTILWTITVAFAMVIGINKVQKEGQFFKTTVIDTIRLTIVLEFVVALYPFSLFGEIVLLSLLASIGMLRAVSEMKQEYLPVKKLSGWALSFLGIVILWHTGRSLLADDSFFSSAWLTELLLPPLLTILFLPFIYLLALFVAYEVIFVRLSFQNRSSNLIGYAKRRIILGFGFNLRKLLAWSRRHSILKISNKESLLNLIKEPAKSPKNDLRPTTCSLSVYRGLAEPLMNEYRQVVAQIDSNFENVQNRQSAVVAMAKLKVLQREVEQIQCGTQFPLKHESLVFTIKHTLDALTYAGEENHSNARQSLNRALLNQQRFDNWLTDIEPFYPHTS